MCTYVYVQVHGCNNGVGSTGGSSNNGVTIQTSGLGAGGMYCCNCFENNIICFIYVYYSYSYDILLLLVARTNVMVSIHSKPLYYF